LVGAQICLSRFHPGDNPGYHAFAAWIHGHAASIVMLTNDETASIDDPLMQLL